MPPHGHRVRGLQIRGQVQQDFPEYIEDLCSTIVEDVEAGHAPQDSVHRTDYTKLPAIAIDDITTMDVDDAVSVEAREEGGWRVAVHVADPAAYVAPSEAMDLEALTRFAALLHAPVCLRLVRERSALHVVWCMSLASVSFPG